jgi:hypothetical protein
MKRDIEELERRLEQATAPGWATSDPIDPEAASLREAWLAFGQLLESGQPPAPDAPMPVDRWLARAKNSTRREKAGWLHRWMPKVAMLAASLAIVVGASWVIVGISRNRDLAGSAEKIATTKDKASPTKETQPPAVAKADEPKWDDSFDEQLASLSWQLACIRQNQNFRTDGIGIFQYQLKQLSQAIEGETL